MVQHYLSYRTRNQTNPAGKPRVYFCCHPADQTQYLEPICAEILKTQNCTIWFRRGEPSPDDDLFFDLSQMQLFVIPVTRRFLQTNNDARTVEFQYAIDNHIPILPLMQEHNLEDLFDQVCGNLQFLDKSVLDPTAIPYEQKLRDFLSSVLISDTLSEQIRAAFRAHIFLSYRKKDRKYANELMKLIHQDAFSRDIAIWFDEFLIPGRDFNEAISAAMEQADLFALAVTPNLVSEQNYVQAVEYPNAKALDLDILPAELVKTDRQKLTDTYSGIPPCINAYDANALSGFLHKQFEDIIRTPNDDDPLHTFFIGLAYLGDIEVEVNHKLAVDMITAAAEAGLPEAMEKLVSMYAKGDGVKQDADTALYWQCSLIEYASSVVADDPSTDNITDLFSRYQQTIGLCFDLEQSEFGLTVCEQYEDLLNTWFENDLSDSPLLSLGSICYFKSCFHHKLRNTTATQGQLLQTIRFLDSLKAQTNESLFYTAQSYWLSGKIEKQFNRRVTAQDFFEQGLAILNQSQQEDSELLATTKVKLLNELYELHDTLGHIELSAHYLLQAINLLQTYMTEHPEFSDLPTLFSLQLDHCRLLKKQGNSAEAIEQCFAVQKQLQELCRYENNPTTRYLYCDTESVLGDCYHAMDNQELSQLHYQKYYQDAFEFYEDFPCDLSFIHLVTAHFAGLDLDNDPPDICTTNLMKALELIDELDDSVDALQCQVALYFALNYLGKRTHDRAMIKKYKRLIKKSGVQFISTELRSTFTESTFRTWKNLWSHSDPSSSIASNLFRSAAYYATDVADFAFSDEKWYQLIRDKFSGWLKRNILIWRIPFYPLLGLLILFMSHFLCITFPRSFYLEVTSTICLGEVFYWSTAPTLMAFGFLYFSKKTQSAKQMFRCSVSWFLFSHILVYLITGLLFPKNSLGGVIGFLLYGSLLSYIALLGRLITKAVNFVLSRLTIK